MLVPRLSIAQAKTSHDWIELTLEFTHNEFARLVNLGKSFTLGVKVYNFYPETSFEPLAELRYPLDERHIRIKNNVLVSVINVPLDSIPCNAYVLVLDLVREGLFWLSEFGFCPSTYTGHKIPFKEAGTLSINKHRSIILFSSEAIFFELTGYYCFLIRNPDIKPTQVSVELDRHILGRFSLLPNTEIVFFRKIMAGQSLLEIKKDKQERGVISLFYQPDVTSDILDGNPPNARKPGALNAMTFYYPWFRTPDSDFHRYENYQDWSRHVWALPQEFKKKYPYNTANPLIWGPHSSHDDYIIEQDLKLIKWSGIEIVIVSWWPSGTIEDANLKKIEQYCRLLDLKFCLLIEDFHDTAEGDRASWPVYESALKYIEHSYFKSDHYFRIENKPVVYEWRLINESNYKTHLRQLIRLQSFKSQAAMFMFGVQSSIQFLLDKGIPIIPGYDAAYQYEAMNIDAAQEDCLEYGHILNPSITPGYDERCLPTEWRPLQRYRDGEKEKLFSRTFSSCLSKSPSFCNIVTYNEITEGTSILPTVPDTRFFEEEKEVRETLSTCPSVSKVNHQFHYLKKTRKMLTADIALSTAVDRG